MAYFALARDRAAARLRVRVGSLEGGLAVVASTITKDDPMRDADPSPDPLLLATFLERAAELGKLDEAKARLVALVPESDYYRPVFAHAVELAVAVERRDAAAALAAFERVDKDWTFALLSAPAFRRLGESGKKLLNERIEQGDLAAIWLACAVDRNEFQSAIRARFKVETDPVRRMEIEPWVWTR
jgi:hypothetical protein